MALPKEPRQKMINLMYLVLTALLALNVSAEILNAFKTVDNSLTSTNKTINASTGAIMKSLLAKTSEAETAEKAKIWYSKADQAQKLTTQMFSDIQVLKDRILKEADFDPARKGDSTFKQDNLDIATRIMVEQGEGKKLYQKLAEYRKNLLAIDPLIGKQLANDLQINLGMPAVQDKSNRTWEGAYFRMVPTVAAITILSKFQNDVKTSENKVVAFCHQQVGQVEVRFDQFAPIVGQSSNYLMPGQEIEITAGVGAFNSQAQPAISIGGSAAQVQGGVAKMKLAAGGIGNHSIPVRISYIDQDGQRKTIEESVEYTVGQANASIALDKMNVLYINVDNPLTIAASGGGDDKVQVSISGGGGSITKIGPGKYNARVTSVSDDCRITVSVDGKVAGASQFRVRTIPDPVATVGGLPSGDNVSAGAFKAQSGVAAWIKDFPFDLKYTVTSFTLTADTDDGDIVEAPCTGNTWSPSAQNVIKGLKAGRLVTIDNIRAVGQDGRSRKLPSLVYYIK
ncbi:gliding motility protein GldM [Chitinophagaceae bacterium LB-8]|uniref:Gliding motility protein GldM n=1 Tax=Paraflavisolibacter caeni TaxID=2982496 RepID=A0A9X3B6V4_9BACT|nr:gliding motility protein GldM [Paraflavisolibacter caeni]MCU7548525.1 gliding motility protein GldM [Paraflavisolibacter caeni]